MSLRYRLSATTVIAFICLSAILGSCSGPGSDNTNPSEDAAETYTPPATACLASPTWVTDPDPPSEIGDGVPVGEETNCQFYQFGWQWFLQLASPVGGSGERGFEALNVFQPGQTDQCAQEAIATGTAAMARSLSVRLAKNPDQDAAHVVPAELAQATGQALYDQDRNIILYTIGYSPNECAATATGYLPNTIETKLSWRVLEPDEPELDTYYQLPDVVVPEISGDPITLGLVGFHLVINTKNHPEFVWLTWEHKANAPTCTDPQTAPTGGWSFLSSTCAECLANPTPDCESSCDFNTGVTCGGKNQPPCAVTGDPNEVCQEYLWGTDPGSETGGNNNDTNRSNIKTLNVQLVGPEGFVTTVPDMAIWQNYQMVGGLWTNGGVPSGGTDVQRGSLELANTTMETYFQQPQQNCFTCHHYKSEKPLDVSHIIDDLLPSSVTGQ